jgi:hypothetical protein
LAGLSVAKLSICPRLEDELAAVERRDGAVQHVAVLQLDLVGERGRRREQGDDQRAQRGGTRQVHGLPP